MRRSTPFPALAAVQDGDETVVERGSGDRSRYYFVSSREITVGTSSVEVFAITDVTERERQRRRLVRRERELGQRNELYRAIMAASFSFIFRVDLEDRFDFVSPSVEEFLGYEPDDLVGEPISVLATDDGTFGEVAEYFEDVKRGKSFQMRDHPVAARSGRTVYVDMRVVPIYDPSVGRDSRTPADIVGMQVMARDASQRRQREGLISVINRVLRHNVRNELTVISGRAQILAADPDGDAESDANTIIRAADRLLAITESAQELEMNRDLSLELESVDVAPIVTESIDRLEEAYPNAVVSAEIPETAVAETLPRIGTAVWELLENAAEHTGPRPTVAVTVTVDDERVLITIVDEGPGVPEDERKVLIDGKEEPLVHGQGLGLYLAYWIVTSLDGEVEIPRTESGTTVTIKLPAASASPGSQ